MIKSEQGISINKSKKHIPMTATLIASVLLALSPKEQVMAQEIEEDVAETETKSIYAKYHSLLNEIESRREEDRIDLELNAAEVQIMQEELLFFIENESDAPLAAELRKEVATVAELEELFGSLLEAPVVEEDIEEVDESIEEEVIEVEEVHTDEAPSDVELNQENTIQPATITLEKSPDQSFSYTVCAGDTLNKIARAHNVTVNEIATLNNIRNVNAIRVGQVLTISGEKTEKNPADDLANLGQPMTNNEFIDFLGNHASATAKEQNLYASVMVAQAALESGFGTSGLSSAPNHNLYGMKGTYQGESVVMRTREYSTAKGWHHVNAHFKKYPSYLESLLDHSAYIRRGTSWAPDYYSGVWLENTTSYHDATAWLQGRYATDPAYASKLNNIIEAYHLTRFDVVGEDDLVVQPPFDNNQPDQDVKPSTGDKAADSTPENTDVSNYRVKSGDTLSRIASAYKMTVRELKEMNSLKSDLILVGQSLKVKSSTVEVKPTVPTPPTTPVKPTISNATSYTVKRGDTLSRIAPLYKMTVRELKDLNNLKSDLILVGQKLKVKQSISIVKPTPPPTPAKPTISNATSYTVKRGDTLSRIAPLYKMTVRELKDLNNLKSDLILVGQKLKVKQSISVVKPTPPPTTPAKPTISNATNYTVKRGDTLSRIAPIYKMSVRELKDLNNLKSDLIFVGQQLKTKAVQEASKQPTVKSYQIKAGDTLSQLAQTFNTTVRDLKEKNNLTSDLIFVNQRLMI